MPGGGWKGSTLKACVVSYLPLTEALLQGPDPWKAAVPPNSRASWPHQFGKQTIVRKWLKGQPPAPATHSAQHIYLVPDLWGFPKSTSGREPAHQCRRHKRCRSDAWVEKIPWKRAWQSTPVFSPGESHGQRSPVDYRSWGPKESDMTEAT